MRLVIPAEIILLTGLVKCILDDLSQHGARVTLPASAPRAGSGVVLKVRGLDAFGTVVWAAEQRFGLQFDEAIALPDVIAIRHYADEYAEHEKQVSRNNARFFVQGRSGTRTLR